tara:strand:- start:1604 stop:2257 length:654 start_codon:yes stop_codon:yes gene_type:complete
MTIVIPCRAGSTRVKNKNFRQFHNSTLLDIKVQQAKSLANLGIPIVINSDSHIAKKIAEDNNIEFIQRPDYYASSECINSEYYEYLANSVYTEFIMILQPTAPLLENSTVVEAHKFFFENLDKYDSLVTADYLKTFAWYNDMPLNYKLDNMPNSQDLNPIVIPTFNIMICRVSELLKAKNVITKRCYFYKVDQLESMEIDTPIQFEIAEVLYARKNK